MEKYTMSPGFQGEVNRFIEFEDVAVLKESLRRLFIEFLEYELRSGLSDYIAELFFPLNSLLDLLDDAAKDKQEHYSSKHSINEQEVTSQQKVISFIKASVNPERIFLLHHSFNASKQERFDLLIIVPSTTTTGFASYEQVINMASIENVRITASLVKAEILEEHLAEGHVFYTIVCNSNNLIYDNGAIPFTEPNKADLAAVKEKASQTFHPAIYKAESFLDGANEYYESNNPAMAAFMLQQTVELSLYALITALLGHCPKTHYFKELKKPLRRCAPELQYILSPTEQEEDRLLLVLEKAYLESRYANNFNISDHDLSFLFGAAQELMEKVAEVFKKKISEI